MKLYNTLSRTVEEITPIAAPAVGVYTCGPTVYDYPHIGNWFTFIRYDLLVRALKVAGLEPKWVMNITDVGHLTSDADEGEDKLEKGAKREGKSAWDVATFYGEDFVAGMAKLNFSQVDVLCKATDHIPEQIELIQKLGEKGLTYVIDDGVYFDTVKFPDYGKMARLDIKGLQAGARVEENKQKRNPTDFALWKFSPKTGNEEQKRDMEWDSPWHPASDPTRKGFPGWHIECSAMSMKYLGPQLDIHAGGIDHIPVHHTNEIAQSEGATGQQFSRYWMHANHILIGGERIAKSSGNGITLQDLEAKGFTPMDLRMLVLESHYRSQSMFSWETLQAAHNRLQSYRAMAVLRWQASDNGTVQAAEIHDTIQPQILKELLEDLGTPQVLAALSQFFAQLENGELNTTATDEFTQFLEWLDSALGLDLSKQPDINGGQKQLISEREKARLNKDWAASDALRDKLKEQGIAIRDTQNGIVWFRTRQ